MAPFRLYSVRINENNITTDNVTMISPRHNGGRQNEYSNYFSLIIGNNGTGKSRLLCSIAKLFKQIYKDKNSTKLFGSKANFNTVPNKVIALTNSLSDHFPLDSSFKKYRSVYERYNRADDFIRNLYKDSKEGKEHTFPLKSSVLLQTIATLVIYYVLCISLLRYFDKNGWNFYPVALIANVLVFVAGLFILKKSKLTCDMQFKNHLLLIGLFFFILLTEVFLVMKKNEAGLGSYYVVLVTTAIIILSCIIIYIILKKYIINRELGFITIFHILGIITCLMYFINQLHMFYIERMLGLEKIIAYSSLLYIQTLIFGTILLLKLKFERKS